MKTWIAANQTLAIVIGVAIIAGLIYLAYLIYTKYATPSTKRVAEDLPIIPALITPVSMNTGTGMSSMGPGHASGGPTAGAGSRVGSGGGGMKH